MQERLEFEVCARAVSGHIYVHVGGAKRRWRFARCSHADTAWRQGLRDMPHSCLQRFRGPDPFVCADCYLRGKEGKALCEAAVRANGYALEYVPKRLITKELARAAIETPFPVKEILWPDGSCLARSAYRSYRPVLSLVPEKCMSEELVALSARLYLRACPTRLLNSFLGTSARIG